MFIIKIKGLPLFLHKASNMFTTDVRQARKYKNEKSAHEWIKSRQEGNDYDEYNHRFSGLNFIVTKELEN